MTGRSGASGFTLVEVMVALLVFGMIAAAGVTILSFSVRAQDATGHALDDIGAVVRLSAILNADLGQAIDRPTRDAAGARLASFSGGAGGSPLLRLTRGGWSNVDASPRASVQKVEYRLDGDALERVGYPALDGAAPLTPAILVVPVSRLALRFRIAGAWSDTWDGTATAPLPDAMELTFRAGEGRRERAYRMLFLVGTDADASGVSVARPATAPGGIVPGSGAPPSPAAPPIGNAP